MCNRRMADEFVARLPLVRDNTGFELQKFVYVQALGSSGRATQLDVIRYILNIQTDTMLVYGPQWFI